MQTFAEVLASAPLLLTEGSIYERLRRDPSIRFDPELAHAALIYDDAARATLEEIHRAYIDIGIRHRLPFAALTDTWRASATRIARSSWQGRDVNGDNVRFLDGIRRTLSPREPLFIGGLTGCHGDAYRPEEALQSGEAERFHAPQVDALAAAGVDFLLAATLPALSEALGIAKAMSATAVPYLISFVILESGTLLDGTPWNDAIATIDNGTSRPPLGYAVNCVHPARLLPALETLRPAERDRVVALQGNTSRLAPWELDGRAELDGEAAGPFAEATARACAAAKIAMVGGCCGTDPSHIEAIASCVVPR